MSEAALSGSGKRRERKFQRKQWWKHSTDQWSTFLISLGAQGVKTTGDRITLCCPYHADTKPSSSIHTVHGGFKCWSANCGHTEHDPLKLIERLANISYAEAFEAFRRFFKLSRVITPDELAGHHLDEKYRQQLKLTADALHYYACSVWLADTAPESAKNTIKWLKTRGVHDVSHIHSLGLMPRQPDLIKSVLALGGTQEDADAAKRILSIGLTAQLMDAVVFIYARSPREITVFKMRVPGPEKEIRAIRVDDDDMGGFGVYEPVYAPFYNHESVKQCTVVEGEFDQLALFQGQLEKGSTDHIVFALGGSGHTGLKFVHELGFSRCNIIGDNDDAGRSYPKALIKSHKDVATRIFAWPDSLINTLPGKTDPDEAVRIHGFDAAFAEFIDDSNYIYASKWCIDNANTALTNVAADNVIGISDVGTEWGALLHSGAERDAFIETFGQKHPQINAQTLLKAVTRQSDGPLGFELRIVDWISATFHPVWWDIQSNELHMWHKKDRMVIAFKLGTPAAAITFRAFVSGGSLYHWVRDDIGLPGYYPDVEADDATQAALDKIENLVNRSVERALGQVAKTAPKNRDFVLGQGIHLGDVEKKGFGYIVNGTRVYKLVYQNQKLAQVSELEGPSDDHYVFDIEYNPTLCRDYTEGWAEYLNGVDDITRAPKYSLPETVIHIRRLLNQLFAFDSQEVDVDLCTCLIFYTNILTCIRNYRTVVHVQGLFESGKTTLLSIIANHNQMGEYSLTRHAASLVTFTQAAFFQSFKNSALFAALDEMNDPDDRSQESAQKQSIWMNLRTLVTSGKTYKVIGTRGGTARPYILFNSVITAAATPIVHDMDASRAVTIRMSKKDGMDNARALLPTLLPNTFASDLRHSIFHHSLNMAAVVPQHYKNLYASFTEKAKRDGVAGLDRSLENVMPLAAIAEVLKLNGMHLLQGYRDSRLSVIVERKEATQEHAVLDAILNAPRIEIDTDINPRMRSIRSLLLDYDNREKINLSSQGIYFDLSTYSIAIAWDNIAGLLTGTRYASLSKVAMKSLADQTKHFVPPVEAMKNGSLARMKAAGLAGARMYSVYNVKYMIEDFEQSLKLVQAHQVAAVQASVM